ncbi:unknown [Clostridium sp. CAG:967]|nr:unknown [Clostridium sp. CAG:967]
MIDYENMDDLTHLNDEEKLEIVEMEIKKVVNISDLLFQALKYHEDMDGFNGLIYGSILLSFSVFNIRKLFPLD